MNPANINYLWSEILVEELVRNGVRRFVISPGSRNSPLVLAAANHAEAETTVHTDERGAAFYAQGYAKSGGKAAALIATSGTAVANFYPAVCEASQSAIPMILLTADRPVELRDTGAPQTMKQANIYGDYVRWSLDLPCPTTEIKPQFVLTTVDQAVHRATRSPAGPVQLNCQFREPLAPQGSGEDFTNYMRPLDQWEKSDRPFTEYSVPKLRINPEELEEIIDKIAHSKRGLIVGGPMPAFAKRENIRQIAARLKMPVLADVASGLRFGRGVAENVMAHYDYVLREEAFCENNLPDLVLHFGGMPTSTPLNRYLKKSSPEYIYVNNTPFRQDPLHQVTRRLEMEPDEFCKLLADRNVDSASDLLPDFQKAERIAAETLGSLLSAEQGCSELGIARSIINNLPENHNLYLANSMPIRDADASGLKRDAAMQVGFNRGVNGIDGTLASAAGFAAGNGRPTTALLGDLALLHDLNSLLLVRNSGFPITVVVLNNNGGGIFSFLPIAEKNPHFEEFFGTPQNVTFEHAAAQFGLDYHKPHSMAEFEAVYREAVSVHKSALIEIQTERNANREAHKRIWQRVNDAINGTLHG